MKKLPTLIVIVKGACYVIIGGLTPVATSLGQWANDEGAWPLPINWICIASGCCVGAATQLLSFLSEAYGTYKAEQNGTAKT